MFSRHVGIDTANSSQFHLHLCSSIGPRKIHDMTELCRLVILLPHLFFLVARMVPYQVCSFGFNSSDELGNFAGCFTPTVPDNMSICSGWRWLYRTIVSYVILFMAACIPPCTSSTDLASNNVKKGSRDGPSAPVVESN